MTGGTRPTAVNREEEVYSVSAANVLLLPGQAKIFFVSCDVFLFVLLLGVDYTIGMSDPKPKRRWFQYSLRTLLAFVTLCALACSWLAVKMRQAERQREAATAIEKLGGSVRWDDGVSKWPRCLRNVLGDDFFVSVECLWLNSTEVTDAGLENLKGLSQLRFLSLKDTRVTDAGLEHLKGLSELQELVLDGTQVTGAGLEHLKGLSQLWGLYLGGTHVTDAGLKHLKGLNQIVFLSLQSTPVTDAGLEHLKRLSQLQFLTLTDTRVTDNGIRRLQKVLPNCRIVPIILNAPPKNRPTTSNP